MPDLGKDEQLRAPDQPRKLLAVLFRRQLIEGAVDDQRWNVQARQAVAGIVRERRVHLSDESLRRLQRLRGGEAQRRAHLRLVSPESIGEQP